MTPKAAVPALLKEPLLHFVLLALAIFGIDYWVLGNRDNPREIIVDAATYDELLDAFKEGRSRLPNEAEMGDVVLQWSQNEVLYREAQRLGLDKGDEMIRSRLILKIRNILFNNVVMPKPSEKTLRAWLEDNRQRYDLPATYDFEQTRLADATDAAQASQTAAMANAGQLDDSLASGIRSYVRRPAFNISSVFLEEDGARLLAAPANEWLAVRSSSGWHIARITAAYPGVQADFDAIRGKVASDWETESRQRELAAALQTIVDDYDIRLDLDAARVRESLTPAVNSGRTAAAN